jgi:hypothetical protein
MKNKKDTKSKNNRVSSEALNQSEEKFLEELIQCVIKKLKSGKYQVKVADAIKAIELKEKMRTKGKKSKEKIFWELIDKIRKEELPKE